MLAEAREMTIAEELILLLLKDDIGFVAPIPEWRMSCALVGAVLLDLSFKNRDRYRPSGTARHRPDADRR